MAKRGPKGVAPGEKRKRGTEQPCRKVEVLFSNHADRPDPENIAPPDWLPAQARKIWRAKVERYRQRGQKIDGFQDALAQYCALEADLLAIWERGREAPPMAQVTAHRIWAAEFYDTPASQKVPAGGGASKANKFLQNGRKDP